VTIVVIGARTDAMTAVTAEMTGTTDVADRDCSGRSGPAGLKGQIGEVMRTGSSIELVRAAR
jgi:hypothetical protein